MKMRVESKNARKENAVKKLELEGFKKIKVDGQENWVRPAQMQDDLNEIKNTPLYDSKYWMIIGSCIFLMLVVIALLDIVI